MKNPIALIVFLLSITAMGQTQFVDVTDEHAISFFVNGDEYGSGVSAQDFDSDGDIDLFIGGDKSYPSKILINENGLYTELDLAVPFQVRAGLWFDHNGDHLMDLFLAGDRKDLLNESSNISDYWALYEQNAQGDFVLVPGSVKSDFTITDEHVLGGLAAGDFNFDGYLDLVITYWGEGDVFLFMNSEEGFDDALPLPVSLDDYFQPLIFDIYGDEWPELYLPVDFQGPNLMLDHDGNMEFGDFASSSNLDHQCDDMGITIGDVENDGDFDLYITCIDISDRHNDLLLNNGAGRPVFLEGTTSSLAKGGWGWGTTFADFTNDELLDLAATNGHRESYGYDQSKFWVNIGNGQFDEVSQEVAFNDTLMASALISLDFDRDGDLDMVQSLKSEYIHFTPLRILENKLEENTSGNFLVIQPRMSGKNHWAIGATVKITAGGVSQMRPIAAGSSFHGQEPSEAFFGLGAKSSVETVEVIWPGGGRSILNNISANQVVIVTDDDALHPPSGLRAEVSGSGSIELFWKKMSQVETGFVLERSLTEDFLNVETISISSATTTYSDTDLEPNTNYFYRVRALQGGEESIPSISVLAKTEEVFVAAPSGFVGEVNSPSSVELTWNDNSPSEDAFLLQRSTRVDFFDVVEFTIPANATSFLDTGLEPGGTYYYRLKAVQTSGESSFTEHIIVSVVFSVLSSDATSDVQVFPNPTNGKFTIQSDDIISYIRLYDLLGVEIEKWEAKSGTFSVDVNLKSGVYLLELTSNAEKSIVKLIVD